jgi:hypothetical protein
MTFPIHDSQFFMINIANNSCYANIEGETKDDSNNMSKDK